MTFPPFLGFYIAFGLNRIEIIGMFPDTDSELSIWMRFAIAQKPIMILVPFLLFK